MGALDSIVRQGKALYAGISAYSPEETRRAAAVLRRLGTPCLIHQPRYSMLDRRVEEGLLETLRDEGIGCIAFSPLEQGLLTDKYLSGIPADSRAAKEHGYLDRDEITEEKLAKVRKLGELAAARGQSLAQMALAWVLRHEAVTSVLFGASRVAHVEAAVAALEGLDFAQAELRRIDEILRGDRGSGRAAK